MSKSIKDMFSRVAASYDLNNRLLSFGIDTIWRKRAIAASAAKPGDDVLDCACGTADLTIAFKKAVGPEGRVVGSDFCQAMLDFGIEKSKKQSLDIEWSLEDVTELSFEDDTFDISSIAFGIRNVDDPVAGLKEMARVVKPGGRVVVLEFGQPKGAMKYLYQFYSRHILTRVGGLISGDPEAYQYLVSSSEKFPAGRDFINLMIKTEAFRSCRYEELTKGICYLYIGVVR